MPVPTERDNAQRIPRCQYCITPANTDPATLEENGFTGYQCNDCRNIYISPLPASHDVENLYGHDGAAISAQRHLLPTLFKRWHAHHLLKTVKRFQRNGRLLEIGVGGGLFLRAADAAGYDVSGSDYNPIQVSEIAKRYALLCKCGDYKTNFADEKFDVIVHIDVLSHFRDPVAEFKEMHAMLKPGGVLVFQTGNFGDLSPGNRWLVDKWQYPDHLYFFSERGVRQLVEQTGFSIVKLARYSRALEFRFHKFTGKLMKFKKRPARAAAPSSVSIQKTAAQRGALYRLAINGKGIFDYALQFWLGRVLPKNGRPQTVNVVCRKA